MSFCPSWRNLVQLPSWINGMIDLRYSTDPLKVEKIILKLKFPLAFNFTVRVIWSTLSHHTDRSKLQLSLVFTKEYSTSFMVCRGTWGSGGQGWTKGQSFERRQKLFSFCFCFGGRSFFGRKFGRRFDV